MALLGHINAMTIIDNDDISKAREMVGELENYSEIQGRQNEVKAAQKELDLKQLQVDTKNSLASVEESNKQ